MESPNNNYQFDAKKKFLKKIEAFTVAEETTRTKNT